MYGRRTRVRYPGISHKTSTVWRAHEDMRRSRCEIGERATAVCVSDNAARMASVIQTDPLPKSAIRHVRCTQERETIPLPPGAPQGEAGWKPRDWLATRSIPLK